MILKNTHLAPILDIDMVYSQEETLHIGGHIRSRGRGMFDVLRNNTSSIFLIGCHRADNAFMCLLSTESVLQKHQEGANGCLRYNRFRKTQPKLQILNRPRTRSFPRTDLFPAHFVVVVLKINLQLDPTTYTLLKLSEALNPRRTLEHADLHFLKLCWVKSTTIVIIVRMVKVVITVIKVLAGPPRIHTWRK